VLVGCVKRRLCNPPGEPGAKFHTRPEKLNDGIGLAFRRFHTNIVKTGVFPMWAWCRGSLTKQ
jgi:hypothetical protein